MKKPTEEKIVIRTERALLRRFTPEDLEAFFRLGSDPEVVRYTADPGGGLRDREHAREILASHPIADYAKYGYGRMAVVWKKTDAVIGFCGLKYLDDLDEVDIGFRLLPEFWGMGLATETGRAVLDHGFADLGLDEIIAFVLPANAGSIRVLEKLGLDRTGRVDYDGHDAWRYAISNPRTAG